MHIIELCVYRF